jgi:hypothetical protein
MTKTNELIAWLKTAQEPHLLDREECDSIIIRLEAAENMAEALDKLAKLGNGDIYGNSIGNVIAQDALKEWRDLD